MLFIVIVTQEFLEDSVYNGIRLIIKKSISQNFHIMLLEK